MSKAINFEELYKKLEKIVSEFEQGKVDLAESVKKFEEAMQIAEKLKSYLKNIEIKIEEIKAKFEEEDED